MSRQRGDAMLVCILALVVLIVVGLTAVVMAARAEQREWQAFAREHKCKVVERTSSRTASTTALRANGKTVFGTTVIAGQVAYVCDDGVKYWRGP